KRRLIPNECKDDPIIAVIEDGPVVLVRVPQEGRSSAINRHPRPRQCSEAQSVLTVVREEDDAVAPVIVSRELSGASHWWRSLSRHCTPCRVRIVEVDGPRIHGIAR